MKISYNWLKEYLPDEPATAATMKNVKKLADILTSVGLEVENLEKYEEVKNSLEGLVTGRVVTCEQHPNAEKLKVTAVDCGNTDLLQIVCGASNVAAGQTVVVATIGTTLYPASGDPITIKKAKIRGVESNGMLCAEDETGLGSSHTGIMVLPEGIPPGSKAFDYFRPYNDWILEIGLTPNRMDAMSHMGVAKDVCAYLSHHLKTSVKMVSPLPTSFKTENAKIKVSVSIKAPEACARYAGIGISGITIAPSPLWLQHRLKSIGLRTINNIVDITNFILHETGQPLHVFDADKITGNAIIVQKLPDKTPFTTLDGKIRVLSREDLMICNGLGEPMCIGGVFGGLDSGVDANTLNIFLESAWFDPAHIRKTSFRHQLRTDAATRFEKGVDIGNTVHVLKRAALLVKEICGGQLSSEIVDQYPAPKPPREITLQNHYLKKVSGKNYHQDTVKSILKSLNFSILQESIDSLRVAAPTSNPDISIPADVIEEIMRIDGLDNIDIPATIKMSPSPETGAFEAGIREKISGWLVGTGFAEIFTNSITNSKYFDQETLSTSVRIINSLSEDLDIMRPSMIPPALECISYNINRKNTDLLFFEFGSTYSSTEKGKYQETKSLALYFTGHKSPSGWNLRAEKTDIFFAKGVCSALCTLAGLPPLQFVPTSNAFLTEAIGAKSNGIHLTEIGSIKKSLLESFSIKQPVYFLSINWQLLVALAGKNPIQFEEIPKFPHVQRDLSIVVDKSVTYGAVESLLQGLQISKMKEFKLFDVFESERLGADKKSMAISFTFSDKEKTLTDQETDTMMHRIITSIEKGTQAEIRKSN